MSGKIDRYVVEAKLLGKEKANGKKNKMRDYAIEVILSDESQYTIYRAMKDICNFHQKLISRFPVEAGYFKDSEKVIPDCPIKKTPFGIRRILNEDRTFERLLNSYIKELPGLPAGIIKSDAMNVFFTLSEKDLDMPGNKKSKRSNKTPKQKINSDGEISHPIQLKSYLCISDYKPSRSSGSKFSINSGSVVQVIQKDPSGSGFVNLALHLTSTRGENWHGWWFVDAQGMLGWCPASYLVPVEEDDIDGEKEENEAVIGKEKVGARYISMSPYEASRDDELSFVKGAIVRVIKKHVDGWWLVRYNGGEGFVPGTLFRRFDKRQATVYVRGIQRKFISRKSTRIVGTMQKYHLKYGTQNNQESTSKIALYQCIAKFSGRSERFEISLNIGDTVKVVDKKDHGWWYVQDQHGRAGWAPASHFKPIIDNSEYKPNDIKTEDVIGTTYTVIRSHRHQRTDELTVKEGDKVVVVWVSDDGWWMVRLMNDPSKQGLVPSVCLSRQEESEMETEEAKITFDDNSKNSITVQDFDNPPDEQVDLEIEDCYVIASDYTRKSNDELTVYEGEIACVIDSTHRDIWYVNVDGKEGWLPSNLLQPLQEQDLELSDDALSNSGSEPRSLSHSLETSDISDNEDMDTSLKNLPLHRQPISSSTGSSLDFDRSLTSSPLSEKDTISSVVIKIDDQSLEDLEKAVAEAEKLAQAAKNKADNLKRMAEDVKRKSNNNTPVLTVSS